MPEYGLHDPDFVSQLEQDGSGEVPYSVKSKTGHAGTSPADAGAKISAILNEFKDRYESLLNDYQKDLYRKICNKSSTARVKDLLPDFDRNKPEHIGALRALRGIGLIVPEKGGTWRDDSYIIITKFRRAINEFLHKNI